MPSEPRLSARLFVEGPEAGRPRLDVLFEGDGGITALMGPSGAGKTTLLTCLAGLLRPAHGRIALSGEVLFDSEASIFRPPEERRVALVFQSLALFPHLSVWENVAYGVPRRKKSERKEVALSWLERTSALHLAHRRATALSGGEAQRVAIARALASEPRLVLLDEPFSALHHELRVELGAMLRELLAASQLPAILVTHDAADVARLASRLVTLDAGRITQDRSVSP